MVPVGVSDRRLVGGVLPVLITNPSVGSDPKPQYAVDAVGKRGVCQFDGACVESHVAFEIRVLWVANATRSSRDRYERVLGEPMIDEPLLIPIGGKAVPGELQSHRAAGVCVAAGVHIGIEADHEASIAKPLAPDAGNISVGVDLR